MLETWVNKRTNRGAGTDAADQSNLWHLGKFGRGATIMARWTARGYGITTTRNGLTARVLSQCTKMSMTTSEPEALARHIARTKFQ